ncbi:AAA family ATPase [Enterovirga rhinocerotis]|uniref:AAA family ATPase n=1 Tax=Enterovirga rhinocerotis TaxID=1339210 RepID=UPI00105E4C3B|nr:AAA family ATPase [Enterovirga rhinocerotis]
MVPTSSDPTSRFVVLTGGPGSGKTTLIDRLAARGHVTMPEAGRAIIRDQMAIGGQALPWADRALFAEAMLAFEMRSHRAAEDLAGPVLFDRGVPDVIGYLRLCGLPVPPHMEEAARRFRYGQPVFVAPPWREIFVQDGERRQDFDEAVRTFEAMLKVYRDCGYDLVELPCASVAERADFVENRLRVGAASSRDR